MNESGGGRSPETENLEHEQELIDGFLARKPALETALVVELQKLLRAEIRRFYPRLWWKLEDLQQDALLRLCEMRADEEEWVLIRPPLVALARLLVTAPASREKRVKHWPRLKRWQEPAVAPDQEETLVRKELWRVAFSLPPRMVRTLLAQEAHLKGDGPPLAVALETDAHTARLRLARAQAAVIRIAEGENVELPKEDEDDE